MVKTKEIDLSQFGYDKPVKVRSLTYGERCEWLDAQQALEKKLGYVPTFAANVMLLKKCVIESPFKIDEDTLSKMDDEIVDTVIFEVEGFFDHLKKRSSTN